MELALHIEENEEIPLFRRLAGAIREAILSQRLKAGEKMPSTPELAQSMSISRATAVKTYKALINEGYLEAIAGSGTFVNRRLTLLESSKQQSKEENYQIPLEHFSSYAKRILTVRFNEPTLAGLPDLNYGSPPIDLLPREQWREMLAKYCRIKPTNQFDFANEIFGYRPLRIAIANFFSRSKGVRCSPEQVILFEGSHAFAHIARLLIEPGDIAIVENPGYLGCRENLHAEGAQVVPVDIDEEGIIVEHLRTRRLKAKLCYVTCAHHDPTGATMSLERRKELLAWAKNNCAFLVEDAFDSDYFYGVPPIPSLQGLDDSGKVLFIYTFWKVLSPLISLGVLVVPSNLIPVFEKAKFLTERLFPSMEHYALTEFISDGHLEQHIKRSYKIYQRRRQKLIYALTQQFRHRISIPRYSGGLHIVIYLQTNLKTEAVLKAAQEANLPMEKTSYFYIGESQPNEFIIPFATISEDIIEHAVERFYKKLNG